MRCLSHSLSLPVVGSLFLAAAACAQAPVPVSQTAMIQADGPKQGLNTTRYFNVEGKSQNKYTDYGVLRFETKALKAELDKKFGAGKYKITAVTLHMTQSLAPFTKDGGIEFYFSPDAKTEIKTPASPLKYPYKPKGTLLTGEKLGKGTFTKPASQAAPSAPVAADYDLFKGEPGRKPLLAALTQGKTVTLVVAETDPNVAATWSAKSITLLVKAAAK